MKPYIIAILLLIASNISFACQFKERSDAQLIADAKTVFRAKVTEVKLVVFAPPDYPGQKDEIVEARYEIKEVLKGVPPSSGIIRDLPFGPGNCSLGLYPGIEYVFFPGQYDMVLTPTGSFGYFTEQGSVAPRLKELRKLATASK
jgi:hypothetical protein